MSLLGIIQKQLFILLHGAFSPIPKDTQRSDNMLGGHSTGSASFTAPTGGYPFASPEIQNHKPLIMDTVA